MTTVATDPRRFAATTSKAWSGSASRFTDEQYQRSCLIDRGGDASIKERCSLPVLEPDGTINTNALGSALAALNGGRGGLSDVSDVQISRAKSKLRSLYRTAGLDVPESLAESDDLPRHELLVALGELETVDVDAIEVLAAGGPYFGTGSPPEGDTFPVQKLHDLAAANNALASQVRPPIKIGHSRAQRLLRNSGLASAAPGDDEQPAAGWLENFRVVGDKLLADAKRVPRKIADLMKAQAFRSRSVEMSRVTEQTSSGAGGEYTAVTALALLGAKAPAVRTLDDILAWYGERGTAADLILADEEAEPDDDARALAVGDVVWDPELGANDLMSDLREALNGGAADDVAPRFWVRDVSTTSRTALVCEGYDDAEGWVVPFTLNAQNDPVPAPMSEWTLVAMKGIQAPANSADAQSAPGADTSGMADETPVAELTDERVVALASALSIDEADADKRRELVLEQIKGFAGETPTPPTPPPTPPDPGQPAPPAPPTPPATDDPQAVRELAELRRDAELGRKAYEDRRVERRDANIGVAIRQGRIDPAQKDQWVRFFDENEEIAMTALLSIPANPRRVYGSDDPARQGDFAEAVVRGYDAAYGSFAASVGITPFTLAGANGGQS